ncbi:hypothetical protein DFH27DRAFT_556340 [Peziza echinospora]|nr:hypothetical protein DFH27DRAFT_556340 [Peziza echinospora]
MDVKTLFDVKGKVVLVTGGAKGVGRMISEGFVSNGAKVYISSRDTKSLESACVELNKLGQASGGSAHYIAADLYKLEDCKRIAEELGAKEKKLDVLVNNSGSNWGASYEEYPDAAWTRVLTLNLQRVFTLTQLLTPLLTSTPYTTPTTNPDTPSRVIIIGSVDGLRIPALGTYAYSASKAGVHHLSRVLANHLGRSGVTVNTLACGPFESKMMKATLEKNREVIEGGIPLMRIGTKEDVAGACLFLASRAGAYINGATITVDGGSVVQSKL